MSKPAAVTITPRLYEFLCGLALAAIILLQIQQDISMVVNLMMVLFGAMGIFYRLRIVPIAILIVLFGGQVQDTYQQGELVRAARALDLSKLLLAMAVLTYVIGQYRLHGLWFGVLPADRRQESAAEQARSDGSLTPAELAGLVVSIPLCALCADFAASVLRQHWTVVGLPPAWKQFLAIAWFVLLVVFVAAHAFRYWRRLQMDRATAQLLLQDLLWNETRGEQRRLNRWIAWKRLKETRGDA